MRLRAFGATSAGLSGPKGGVTRHPMIAIASKGNPDGQAEGTTRHYSRVDGTCARETTVRPAGTGFCKRRDPTAQPSAQSPNAARRDHGMAAATHRPTLIGGKRFPQAVSMHWAAIGAKQNSGKPDVTRCERDAVSTRSLRRRRSARRSAAALRDRRHRTRS
jgi:hypothetical protein